MEAIDFLNKIIPDHNRTTCDDENVSNGFYTGTGIRGRCRRCMCLEIIMNETNDRLDLPDFKLEDIF